MLSLESRVTLRHPTYVIPDCIQATLAGMACFRVGTLRFAHSTLLWTALR